jgi:GNAT superfamily N-acetyltransferase
MTGFSVKSLGEITWPDFAPLVEKHNGVWGGCWCMAFHGEGVGRTKTAAQNRTEKECRVREGRAHAALVYDGSACVGWCQFGATDELPHIKHKRAYAEGLTALPDWRITCFFVDRSYRGNGVAFAALEGALREIPRLGEERWKATRRPSTVDRYPDPSFTMERFRCSSSKGSGASVASGRTTGSSPRSCAHRGQQGGKKERKKRLGQQA